MKLMKGLIALALLLLSWSAARAQLLEKKVLTLEAAEKIASAAEAEARKRNATVVIVVVDDGGYPLVLKRLNDTQVASVEVGMAGKEGMVGICTFLGSAIAPFRAVVQIAGDAIRM